MAEDKLIHVEWEGPISLEDAKGLTGGKDYGLYQIYGCHTVYGSDVLLYIGKAVDQPFGTRLKQESDWTYNQDVQRISVYVGRIITSTPADIKRPEWAEWVGAAEEVCIYAHAPACNSRNIQSINCAKLSPFHVLNWGSFRDLLPEVSGHRWTDRHYEGEWQPIVPADLKRGVKDFMGAD